MALVTDQNVLAQLNGSSVSDPELLKQLNAPAEQPQPQNVSPIVKGVTKGIYGLGNMLGYSPEQISGGISGAAQNPFTNAALGVGDSQRNLLANTANVLPGVNIPLAKTGEGTAYEVGKLGGDILGFAEGGSLLKTASKLGALKNAGMLGKGAQALLNNPGLSRIGGSAAYGAITNPDNRLGGAALGGALGAAGEAIPYAASLVGKPRQTAEAIKDYIKSEHGRASNMYNEIEKAAKDTGDIYKTKNNMYTSQRVYGQYKSVDPKVFEATPDLQELHDVFKAKPTYENAHLLQSKIGNILGKVSNKAEVSPADHELLEKLGHARNAIRGDMLGHLDRASPDLAAKYREASNIYKDIIDPKRLIDKWRNPGPKEVLNELQKVNDKSKFNPLSPELQSKMNQLRNDKFKQTAAVLGTLGLGGMGHGAHLLEGAIAGKLLGMKASPQVIGGAQNLFRGIGAGANALGTGIKATIPPLMGENE